MQLLIHAGINVKPWQWKGTQVLVWPALFSVHLSHIRQGDSTRITSHHSTSFNEVTLKIMGKYITCKHWSLMLEPNQKRPKPYAYLITYTMRCSLFTQLFTSGNIVVRYWRFMLQLIWWSITMRGVDTFHLHQYTMMNIIRWPRHNLVTG